MLMEQRTEHTYRWRRTAAHVDHVNHVNEGLANARPNNPDPH